MCGIAGIWGGHEGAAATRTMMRRLAHRGPDDEAIRVREAGAIGHVRLAIMDPDGGKQPIESVCGERAIAANGELYNHPTLRRRLEADYPFRTGSDTESALHLYDDMGPRAVRALDGTYALAIADASSLFLARDPIGIKPLYYGERDGDLVFASELKAMVGIADRVREFPPGAFFHSDLGFRPYYVLNDRAPREMPLPTRLDLIRETLARSVEKRLMSDVPVGAFLSGGLDSSLIAALARPRVDELHTFSIGFEGSPDLAAARRVADFLDTVHHERVLTLEEVEQALPTIVYFLESYDQDLVRSAVPCYFVSELASRYVKVVLTGEGADELFAGYRYYESFDDDSELHAELRRSVGALHNVNLQRVDRLTMAHSIEGRVPFLDLEMIELAQSIPPGLKLHDAGGGRRIEKWILRKAFEGLLPDDILWRDKQQFDEATGTIDPLGRVVSRRMSVDEASTYVNHFPEARLRSAEECAYHHLLRRAYGGDDAVMGNVARWAEGRLAR